MAAAENGHAEVCRLLLEHGADSNAIQSNVRLGRSKYRLGFSDLRGSYVPI